MPRVASTRRKTRPRKRARVEVLPHTESGGVVRVQCCHCRGEQLIRSPGLREARRPPRTSSSPPFCVPVLTETTITTYDKDDGSEGVRAFSRYCGWPPRCLAAWLPGNTLSFPEHFFHAFYALILVDRPMRSCERAQPAALVSQPAPFFVLSFLFPSVLPSFLSFLPSLFLSFFPSVRLSSLLSFSHSALLFLRLSFFSSLPCPHPLSLSLSRSPAVATSPAVRSRC